jgi:hypothetical protein
MDKILSNDIPHNSTRSSNADVLVMLACKSRDTRHLAETDSAKIGYIHFEVSRGHNTARMGNV